MVDLQSLAQKLVAAGLMDKAFKDMGRQEVLELCAAILATIQEQVDAEKDIPF